MDRRDLRSVLRLFAEIASTANEDEGAPAPDCEGAAQGGEESVPGRGRDDAFTSSTAVSRGSD